MRQANGESSHQSCQLSAGLIVKNEARFLGDCLNSLRGIVDEIVVVDTGSTDGSREIAIQHGACVVDYLWNDDFSAARNFCIEHCSGEWILYIDADERVRLSPAVDLKAELSASPHAGHQVLLYPRQGFTPYRVLRLFRNLPDIRFHGVIHENLWPSVEEYCRTHDCKVGSSNLVLDHAGYEGNRERKNARNLPLLLRAVQEDPRRVFLWCHLADIYTDLNSHDLAEEAWTKALAIVGERRTPIPEDALPYIGLIRRGYELGRDVSALVDEARARFPFHLSLEWWRGRMLMRQSRFDEAESLFEKLIERGHTGNYDHWFAYDSRLFTVDSYEALAICHFRTGRYAESRRYYELALQHEPDSLNFRVKVNLCTRLLAREPVQA